MLLSRRFLPLFACQFFSAFNDNFLKTSLVFLILFGATEDRSALITLASAIFIAPFFFLSALGGEIADRFDKAVVAQRLKFAEIAIAGIAIAGYATGSLVTLFVALAGFGVIAALFGPIKYGILPDHLTARAVADRQCADRSRDLHRHPDRHHCRRPRHQGRRRRHCSVRARHGFRGAVLGFGAVHPADRLRRAGSEDPRQSRRFHRGDAALPAR